VPEPGQPNLPKSPKPGVGGTPAAPGGKPKPAADSYDGPTLDMASEVTSMSGINATVDWSASKSGSGDAIGAPGFEVTLDMPAKPVGVPPPMAVPIPTAPAPGSGAPKSASPAGGPSVHASAHVSFASQPAVSATGFPIIDGYDLVRAAGKGGMGVVYEAIQLATGRRVAIKLLPEAALASELARTRFAREVEVVARLQHPGIVPILDSGVRKGLYFYAMDFVDGEPLDAVMPPGKADAQKVAVMICEICDSVDYAHQRGVLHRDLKPGNVLVDKQGKPHLLDFGLAKQTGDSSSGSPLQTGVTISGAGQLLGTVAFMSPEQAAGNADQASVRSDVYSLGVMTYLLMTGKLPISMNGSLREVLTWIADREPTAPSKIKPELGKDIDAILLKSLEKIPDRRYATAGELAADLRRWLADEAILARPISTQERSVRWVRKNKTLAGTVAAATLALVVVSATLITRIVQERNRANAAAALAEEKRADAEKSEAEVRVALDKLVKEKKETEGVMAFTGSVFDDPELSRRADITLLELLDNAGKRLDGKPIESPGAEISARELLARVYQRAGKYASAQHQLERSLNLRDAAGAKEREDEVALADTLHNLAASLWWQRNYEQAEPLYQRSLAMRRQLFPGDSREVALSLTHLGACLLGMGRREEAHVYYSDALEMRKRIFGPEHEQVAAALNNLSKSYAEQEDYERAERLSREALEMIIKLRGPKDAGTASASQNLGLNLLEKGDARGAEAAFAQAVAIRQALFPLGHHLTGNSLCGLARAKLMLGETGEALRNAQESLDLYTKIDYDQAVDLADARCILGEALLAAGRPEDALGALRSAREALDSSRNPPRQLVVTLMIGLGEALCATDDQAQARVVLQRALDTASEARGTQSRFAKQTAERVARSQCGPNRPTK